ncbi:MAG: hypothetical protein GX224_06020 [Thermoplasmatales archaeon]|nr:hypothetical protein [Thermoplasmatales archaeon]
MCPTISAPAEAERTATDETNAASRALDSAAGVPLRSPERTAVTAVGRYSASRVRAPAP